MAGSPNFDCCLFCLTGIGRSATVSRPTSSKRHKSGNLDGTRSTKLTIVVALVRFIEWLSLKVTLQVGEPGRDTFNKAYNCCVP
jgi:hypothetical protein